MENKEKQQNREEMLRQKEIELKILLKRMLTAKAFERLSNVKIANPELYALAVQALVQLYSREQAIIDDAQLKEILIRLRNNIKKDIKIKRK